MSYEDDTKADKHRLDWELERQSSLYTKYAKLHQDLVNAQKRLKSKLELVEAKVSLEIRKDHKKFGFTVKPTEAAIKCLVIQDKKYQRINEELMDMNDDIGTYAVAKEALNHKKTSLVELTHLWLGGYYSSPSVSSLAKEKFEDNKREIIKEVLNKKKKRRKV